MSTSGRMAPSPPPTSSGKVVYDRGGFLRGLGGHRYRFTDVTLVCEDTTALPAKHVYFESHRIVLASASAYFNRIIQRTAAKAKKTGGGAALASSVICMPAEVQPRAMK